MKFDHRTRTQGGRDACVNWISPERKLFVGTKHECIMPGVVASSSCFGNYRQGDDIAYFIRPKRVSDYFDMEIVNFYIDLVLKAGLLESLPIISSQEELALILENFKIKDNIQETWEDIEKNNVIPVFFKGADMVSRSHMLASLSSLRYVDDPADCTVARKAVELAEKYGNEFSPLQYIVFAHHLLDEPPPRSFVHHVLIGSAIINSPKTIIPKEAFLYGVNSAFTPYQKMSSVIDTSLNYHYWSEPLKWWIEKKGFTLPTLIEYLNSKV